MKPIGPLMWEHRLIEKMLASMMRHIDQVEKSKKVNPLIIDMAVDFVRSGQVKTGELITHRFPLDRIKEGFETQLDPGNSIKVVITP